MHRQLHWITGLVAGLLMCSQGFAAELAGRVVHIDGAASFERNGQLAVLYAESALMAADKLQTRDGATLAAEMDDQGRVLLMGGTDFYIDSFQLPVGNSQGLAAYRMERGGCRLVTGEIAAEYGGEFLLSTPAAKVLALGTDYVAILVDETQARSLGIPAGLYVRPTEGSVRMENTGGTRDVQAGQIGFAASASVAPVLVDQAPAALQTLLDNIDFDFDMLFEADVEGEILIIPEPDPSPS